MKLILLASALALLSGCSVGHTEFSKEAYKKTDLTFVGIPTVLGVGFSGTTTPVTPTLSLTAKHVAVFTLNRVKSYHPYCDLALIYHDNSNVKFPNFKNPKLNGNVNLYGFSGRTALGVESKGTLFSDTRIDNLFTDKNKCVETVTTAGSIQGMSGGVAYNDDGTISGIIVAQSYKMTNPVSGKSAAGAIIVPYSNFSQWLEKEAGIKAN